MRPAAVAELAAETCPSCGGLWLDPSSLTALQRRLGQGEQWLRRPFVPRPAEALLSCTACPDGHLRPGTVRDVRAFRCTACRGVFLPAGLPSRSPPPEGGTGEFEPDAPGVALDFLADIVGAFF